jgi:hypothetical protein
MNWEMLMVMSQTSIVSYDIIQLFITPAQLSLPILLAIIQKPRNNTNIKLKGKQRDKL